MFSTDEIWVWLHTRPFVPSRFLLRSGESWEIVNPEMARVGRDFLLLGTPSKADPTVFETATRVALSDVVDFQPLCKEGVPVVAPEELRDTLKQKPFEPFRLVMTDGEGYEIRHPDLLMVGRRTATIGLTGEPGQVFYERTVKVDLLHIIRIEPLEMAAPSSGNGETAS